MKQRFGSLPKDGQGESIQLPPHVVSVFLGTNPSSVSSIDIPPTSGMIEVQADGGLAYLKYGDDVEGADISPVNFHERIQGGFCRHYAIPNGSTKLWMIGGAGCTGYVVIFR